MTDELNALAGAYALDALDDDERAVFEQHLAGCPACTEEVRGLRNAAAELSHLSEAGPPPELRAAVLGAVAQSRPLPPRVPGARVLPLRRARATALWQGLAAACALIAVAASVWGYSQHREAQRAQTSVVQSLLAAPDVRATTTALKQGQGTLLSSRSEHRLVLIARGLPALPAGRTYQLWLMSETGAPVPGGVFRPDEHGNVEVPAAGNLDAVDRMGVSVEPAGGSAQPTLATVQVLKL
ncbi:anti-sigma factor [Jatrophihabitans sp.]|uniref:anti-sigma factor n=1 Tax=Jatrophihabitans sp. TaxID=1932789 RepID=UPI002BB07446|nr:anti-sigma factor [Jatrophihabitans sp.]